MSRGLGCYSSSQPEQVSLACLKATTESVHEHWFGEGVSYAQVQHYPLVSDVTGITLPDTARDTRIRSLSGKSSNLEPALVMAPRSLIT